MNWMTNSIHFLLIALTIVILQGMFFSPVSIIPALVICLIWTFVMRSHWRKGFVALYVLFIAVGYKHYVNDLLLTIDALAQPLATSGIYVNPLPVAAVPMLYNGVFFSSIALLITSGFLFALRKNSGLTVILTALIIWGLQLVFTTQPPLVINILYFNAVLINLLYMRKINAPVWKTIFSLPALLGTLMIIGAFFINAPQKDASSAQLEQALTNKAADIRYFNGQSPTLSDGNLLRISAFQPNEEVALKIVMEQPMPLYLKGFVGSQYTASTWQQADAATYLQHKSLLDALQHEQFTSGQQLYLAAEAGLGEQTTATMTIQNIHASSRYFYTPYELTELKAENIQTEDYTTLESTKFFGERTYQLNYMNTAVNEYPKIASSLYELHEAPYLNYESYYNHYVYEQFLQLPSETKSLLLNHVGESFSDVEHLSYEQAISMVTSSVETLIQYNEDVEHVETDDFLMSLLEETREGYSVHYATVGTLLFRTLGIPSRYVEGYLVTPDDITDAQSYNEIEISEKNVHAWTEIYIDLVGWIPIELTPPYKTVMPPVNVIDYPEAATVKSETDSVFSSSADGQAKQVQDDPDLPDASEQMNETTFSLLYILLGAFLLLLLLAFYSIYKRYKVKRNTQLTNYRCSIIYYFSRLLDMLEKEGLFVEQRVTDLPATVAMHIAPDLEMQMQLCVESYQRAMYSPKKLTKFEQDNVKELYTRICKSLAQSKKYKARWLFLWRNYMK
ncbi:MAG: transglutaminase domain-containing protein [Solibacillus sp.]